MYLHFTQRARRRTVFAVLALWLFALGAGWANACLLKERGTHLDGDSAAASASAEASFVSAGHVGADSAHDEGTSASGKACLKFCDDETQTVVKPPTSFDLTDVAMAPPFATLWTSQAATLAVGYSLPGAGPLDAGLPLRTRYSRLAL